MLPDCEARTLADLLVASVPGADAPPPYRAGRPGTPSRRAAGRSPRSDVDFLSGTVLTAVFAAPSAQNAQPERDFGARGSSAGSASPTAERG